MPNVIRHFAPLAAAIAALASGVALAADLAEIKSRGVMRVAISPLSPFIIKSEDGAFEGFEIDALADLSARLGVDVKLIETPFCELADAIVNGEADIIASGYSNIAPRRAMIDFTLPYHDTEYMLTLSKKAKKRAKTLRGVNRQDISIGYQKGGVSETVATGEFSGANLQAFSSFPEIIEALREGTIDGAILFAPYPETARKMKGRDYVVANKYALTRTIEAFGIEKGADELRDAINAWIIERDLEGYWDDLEEKWFDPERMVVGEAPNEACKALTPTG